MVIEVDAHNNSVESSQLGHGRRLLDHRGQASWLGSYLEWAAATESGPADYVLFTGTRPLGVVEAKKRRRDVSAALGP